MSQIGSTSDLINSFLLKQCGNSACESEPGDEKSTCGKCKTVWYCNIGCQKADWRARHKKECKPNPLPEISWLEESFPDRICAAAKCPTLFSTKDLILGCATCEKVNYCSIKCLKQDRFSHKESCIHDSFLSPECREFSRSARERIQIKKEMAILSMKPLKEKPEERLLATWHYTVRLLLLDRVIDNYFKKEASSWGLSQRPAEAISVLREVELSEIRVRGEYLLAKKDPDYDLSFVRNQLISALEELLKLKSREVTRREDAGNQLFLIEELKENIRRHKASRSSGASASAASP